MTGHHLLSSAGLAGDGPGTLAGQNDYPRDALRLHLDYVRPWTAGATPVSSRATRRTGRRHLLDLYAAADVPETEVFRRPDEALVSRLKLASSAGHVAGRTLASAVRPSPWLGEHFQVSLAQAKEAAGLAAPLRCQPPR